MSYVYTIIVPEKKASFECSDITRVRDCIKDIYISDINPVYTAEEIDEKAADAAGWCETATEETGMYEGECFIIKVRPTYRTYYTLRQYVGNPSKQVMLNDCLGRPMEFDSFEEAYDMMAETYIASKLEGVPARYGIWRTAESGKNSMTQPVWAA